MNFVRLCDPDKVGHECDHAEYSLNDKTIKLLGNLYAVKFCWRDYISEFKVSCYKFFCKRK